jgi:hypothetical protein
VRTTAIARLDQDALNLDCAPGDASARADRRP